MFVVIRAVIEHVAIIHRVKSKAIKTNRNSSKMEDFLRDDCPNPINLDLHTCMGCNTSLNIPTKVDNAINSTILILNCGHRYHINKNCFSKRAENRDYICSVEECKMQTPDRPQKYGAYTVVSMLQN